MTTVWKYEWPLSPARAAMSFDMPHDAEVLYAREQRHSICIWARVNPANAKVKRTFALAGTGHDAPGGRYIGSAHFNDGYLVLHVFEVGSR